MDDSRILSIAQVKDFLKGSQKFDLSLDGSPVNEKYKFIDKTVDRVNYKQLSRGEKRIVISYLKKFTGYKRAQLQRLVKRSVLGKLVRKAYKRLIPVKIYSSFDIKLLEKTDELHLRLSEMATQEVLRRESEVFGNKDFLKISSVSHSHITNLRNSIVYKNSWINHTKSRLTPIGITMKPENLGRPGSIRIDSVSQKDIYHINTVDEITQWEVVFCVPQITEEYMIPALKEIFDQYPFTIFNFHSDRGGENINYQVANFLQRLLIKQTKSRSYHSNDNALVETKNGSVIRKNMGWEHVSRSMTNEINGYYKKWFNPYLNYHRPCGFPTITVDSKGRKKKVYKIYKVPYDALKQIPNEDKYLKTNISFKELDIIALSHSDNEFASLMRTEERKLFDEIHKSDGLRS